jgi:hypothetical protein
MKSLKITDQNKQNEALPVPPGGGTGETPYPDFRITSSEKWNLDWDEKTRRLVIDRVENVPAYRFFSMEEAKLLEALCNSVLPQQDRPEGQQVPIAPWIDQGLYTDEGLGYRYENMPEDRRAYRMGLQGFDQTAHYLFGAAFIDLDYADQKETVRQIGEGSPPGEIWEHLSAVLFFQRFMSDVITNYYAHPAAWAEIGFSGPSSPRGHIRVRLGMRDDWEAEEHLPRSSVEIVRRSRDKHKGPAKGGPTH